MKAMFNEDRGTPQPTVYVGEGYKQTWHQVEELFDGDVSWSNMPWSPTTILKVLQTVCSQGHCNLTSFGQLRVCNSVGRKLCALCPVVLIHVPSKISVLVSLDRWRSIAHIVTEACKEADSDDPQPSAKKPRVQKVEEIFPNLVEAIRNIIETMDEGIRAHSRRRDDVSHVGVTAPFLATALQRQYNISISVYAVRHLFLPPKTSTLEASKYKGLLPMRLYSPRQDEHGAHIDSHFLSAEVKLLIEMGLECAGEVVILSADRKAVVPCGTVAVSGHLKVPSYSEKARSLPDHTWVSDNVILPFAVMELDIKNASRQVDSVGRSRWKTPRSGNLFFFLRKESNPLTDAWDVTKCLKGSKKPVGVVVVDNCVSDGLGPSGHVAFLCLGMMWLHAGLDVLIVTSYAPNRSFQNMVELLFGWVSQRLAGNVISEDPDAAMLDIRNLVDGMRDGYSVLCDIPPDGPPADWPSYDTLPAFTRSSNKQIRSDESLREVYERFLFFLDHCDRRTNLLAFIRCSKKNCPCAKKPWRAKRFRAELDHLKGLPTSIPHPAHADHFLSYAEHREQRLNADPDTHQPSFAKCPGRCTLCRYVFKGENDKAVHNRLRHPRSGSLLNE